MVCSKAEVTEISHRSEVPVVLSSLEAFDDLMESGFTVVDNTSVSGTPSVKEGQQVELEYTLCVWDGSSSKARQAEKASGCTFTVGVLDPYFSPDATLPSSAAGVPPPPGLHDALQRMSQGASATVVLAPETAFGAHGLPYVNIPEIAHIVYFLRVTRVSGTARAGGGTASSAPRSSAPDAVHPLQDKSALAKSISARYGAWTSNQSCRTSFAPHAGRSAAKGASAASAGGAARSIAPAQSTHNQHSSGAGSKSLQGLSPEEAEAVVRARIAAMEGGGAPPPAAASDSPAGFRGMLGSMFGNKSDREKEISIAPASSNSILPASR